MLSKTTQSATPPSSTPEVRAALIQVSVFPLTGGIATGLWLENWAAGAAAYYALLALALASPEGRPLRETLTLRRRRAEPVAISEG